MALTKLNVRSATALDATVLTGNLPAISGGSLTGISAGITAASQWRVNSEFSGDAAPIASNWEVNDTTGYGGIGSAMSESSGIFTFPSTGIWLITFKVVYKEDGENRWAETAIQTTTNNSTYINTGYGYGCNFAVTGNSYSMAFSQILFDVTDTSNCKCRFQSMVEDDSTQAYCGDHQTTGVTFERLGDT